MYVAPLIVQGELRPWKFFVIENLNAEFILGQDFLSFYNANLCCRTHRILWGKPLRKIPQSLHSLLTVPALNNRFNALEEEPIPIVAHMNHSAQRQHRPRVKKQRSQSSSESFSFESILERSRVKLNENFSEEEEDYALAIRSDLTISPMTSIRLKVDVTNPSTGPLSIQKKRLSHVSNKGMGSSKDFFILEGITNAYPSSKGSCTYIQITNLTPNRLQLRQRQIVGTLTLLAQGTKMYDLSAMEAFSSNACVADTPLSEEKRNYILESVKFLSPAQFLQTYRALALEFHDVFASSKDDIGHTNLVTHKLHLKDPNQVPVFKKQFPIPWAHQEFISQKVDDMLRQGIIEESFSPYNSPVFAVKKPHCDDLRMVVDLRHINEITHCSSFRVRCVQECVDEVSQHKSTIFSTLDISQAFYQITLEKKSRPLTSFTVPGKGAFMFTRLPMGLHSSPASLSRVTNYVTRDMPSTIAYMDDLILHSKTHQEHLVLLRQLLQRLRKYGLKLQAKKCELGADSVTYLGYQISKEGVRPGKEKVAAVKEFPPPANAKQIRQFCGLANYFRHMIPNFSRNSGHLTALTKKGSDWKGGELPSSAKAAFQTLKNSLTSFPLLSFPDPQKTFHVFTDGAIGSEKEPGGLGAVLCQEDDQHIPRPVAYASRSLHSNEKNYSAFLIEMSAIVFAIQHWHTYLYGRFFRVHCDHKPIEKLKTVHKKTLNRLQELMLEYNFELQYNPGVNNGPADALSRNPINALGSDHDLVLAQAEDAFCVGVIEFLKTGKLPLDPTISHNVKLASSACSIAANGALLYHLKRDKFPEKKVVVVPLSFQYPLIKAAHCSRFSGHLGIFKTVNRLFAAYWWPGLQAHVTQFIKECETCQLSKTPPNFKREVLPSHPLPVLDSFNDRVHIDTIGKMRGTHNPWLLVITCAFSKYVVAVPIKQRDAETQAQAIYEHWVCRFGCPKTIVHDGDPAYCGELFQTLCKLLGTQTIQISSYHCQSNGGVEVYNKVFQSILRSLLPNPTEPYEPWLPAASLAYNTSVNQATNSSPFFLLYGCDPNLPQFDNFDISPYNINFPEERFLRLRRAREFAKEQLHESAAKNKEYYDRFAKECKFALGERALLHFPRSTCLQGHTKFFKEWHPVVVLRILNQTTYVVRKLKRSRSQRDHVVHCNRLKKFFPITVLPQYLEVQGGKTTSSKLVRSTDGPGRTRATLSYPTNPYPTDPPQVFGEPVVFPGQHVAGPQHRQQQEQQRPPQPTREPVIQQRQPEAAAQPDQSQPEQRPAYPGSYRQPPSPAISWSSEDSSGSADSFDSLSDLPPPPPELLTPPPAQPPPLPEAPARAARPARKAPQASGVDPGASPALADSGSRPSSGRVDRQQPANTGGGSDSGGRGKISSYFEPLARGLFGTHLDTGAQRRTRSTGQAPEVPLPRRPLEYKQYKPRGSKRRKTDEGESP